LSVASGAVFWVARVSGILGLESACRSCSGSFADAQLHQFPVRARAHVPVVVLTFHLHVRTFLAPGETLLTFPHPRPTRCGADGTASGVERGRRFRQASISSHKRWGGAAASAPPQSLFLTETYQPWRTQHHAGVLTNQAKCDVIDCLGEFRAQSVVPAATRTFSIDGSVGPS